MFYCSWINRDFQSASRWWTERMERRLFEAWHFRGKDWHTIKAVIQQGVVLMHLSAKLMEAMQPANRGWCPASSRGVGVNSNKMSASIKGEWRHLVFHWQLFYNNPANSLTASLREAVSICNRFPSCFCFYPALCYRAAPQLTLNNLWSGTLPSVTN